MSNIDAGTYSISLGELVFEDLNVFLSKGGYKKSKFFIFGDENTLTHCLPTLIFHCDLLKNAELIETESGEHNKTIETCYQIWKVLTELEADRDSVVINLSGGMLSDMGGFIASTFKRGIRFINIPTSLLSMVDASVGGKVAVDLEGLKNQIGLFSEPQAVFINSYFLETLDEREMLSGFAEMIKHGLIRSEDHYNNLTSTIQNKTDLKNDLDIWDSLIEKSVLIKKEVVEQDFKEGGLRKILNFGHTIGHAMETLSLTNDSDPLKHGEAVAAGLVCETYISMKQNKFPEGDLKKMTDWLKKLYQFRTVKENEVASLLEIMKHDKKNKNGELNFVLLKRIGEADYDIHVDEATILESFVYFNSVC
jgi:3-dehydroquinate synthase